MNGESTEDLRIRRETNLYRTIIGVEARPNKHQLVLRIVGWSTTECPTVSSSILPSDIFDTVKAGDHLIARVNVGAATAEDLQFHDCELAPPLDDDDGLA